MPLDAEYFMLVLFLKLNFQFEFKAANQPGFEPGSPGPKAAIQTIKLHSFDTSCKFMVTVLFLTLIFTFFLSSSFIGYSKT